MKIKYIFLLLAIALTACAGSDSNKASAENKGLDAAGIYSKKNADTAKHQPATAPKGKVIEVTSASQVSERPARPTFVDFNADWCGPCRQFAPVFEAAAAKYGDKADFLSVNVDQNPMLAEKYMVQSIPLIICIMPDGQITKSVGFMDSTQFNQFVEFHFEK
ncbi:MAG: thioredoxin fold domain-containing protein [Muribaculaceae bacterium]|nr:thioredoxin fold domain-containing protein [Muribaculaceae bacterium]